MRGACALRPGVRGLSSRIRVRSVIGRFLEHSRIFVFGNGGKTELFLGSADWMQRNMYERVEVIFRLKDPALCNQIFTEVITPYLADNLKTRILQPDGEYLRLHEARKLAHLRNGHRFNVQEFLIELSRGPPDPGSRSRVSRLRQIPPHAARPNRIFLARGVSPDRPGGRL